MLAVPNCINDEDTICGICYKEAHSSPLLHATMAATTFSVYIMFLLTELEVHTRKYLSDIQSVWTERSEVHAP